MTILITGANRGIGYKVSESLSNKGKSIILTGRNEEKVKTASLNFSNSKYLQLDVSNKRSIEDLPKRMKEKGITEISALINNAGILQPGWNATNFERTMNTNLFGPLRLIETLFPFLQVNGKIINVSAGILGKVTELSPEYQEIIANITNVNEIFAIPFNENDTLMTKKPTSTYSLSKALLNKATQLLAKDFEKKEKQVKIAAVCPGWCKTDLGTAKAPREASRGADSITWLIDNDDYPSGSYYRDGKPIPW